MLKLFQSNQPIVNVIITAIVLLLGLAVFLQQIPAYSPHYFRFPDLFSFINNHSFVRYLVWSFLIISEGIFLNYLVNKHKLLNQITHIPFIVFVLLNGLGSSLLVITPIHFVNLFVLLVLHQFFELYNTRKIPLVAFNIGLFVGVGAVFYLPSLFLLVLVAYVLRFLKPPYWKEYVVAVLGALLPFVYVGVYQFLNNEPINFSSIFFMNEIQEGVSNTTFAPIFNRFSGWGYYYLIGLLVVGGLILLLAFWEFIIGTQKSVVRIRKYRSVVMLLFVSYLIQQVIFETSIIQSSLILLLCIPVSIIFGEYFLVAKKKWWSELVFILLVIAVLINLFLM